MLECFHPNYTILDRARMNQLPNLCTYLVQKSIAGSALPHETPMDTQAAADMEIDPETGMVINGQMNGSVDALAVQFTEDTRL